MLNDFLLLSIIFTKILIAECYPIESSANKIDVIENGKINCLKVKNYEICTERNIVKRKVRDSSQYQMNCTNNEHIAFKYPMLPKNIINIGNRLVAYNKTMIDKVTCCISDVPIEENEDYKYGTTSLDTTTKGEKFIIFSFDPNYWHYSKWKQFKKFIKVIVKKPVNKKMELKRA